MILLVLAAAASAPSFDCAKATTSIEKMICADAELAAADRAMARLYAGVSRSDHRTRSDQRDFLTKEYNLSACSDRDCLLQAYEDRLGTLFAASRLKLRQYSSEPNNGTLTILPVGDGWYAFHVMGFWVGPNEGQVNDAEVAGVFKLADGRASRAPVAAYDCGWKISRVKGGRWRLRDWPGSDGPACGGVNATIEGVYSP
jgi:uncharacterized protein